MFELINKEITSIKGINKITEKYEIQEIESEEEEEKEEETSELVKKLHSLRQINKKKSNKDPLKKQAHVPVFNKNAEPKERVTVSKNVTKKCLFLALFILFFTQAKTNDFSDSRLPSNDPFELDTYNRAKKDTRRKDYHEDKHDEDEDSQEDEEQTDAQRDT